jgi:hypothetical protein
MMPAQGVTQWHCFRFEGQRGGDVEARSAAAAVPPLVTREWLLQQVVLDGPRLGRGGNAAHDRLREGVPGAMERLRLHRDVVWGYWLANRKYVAVAVLTVA